jgi:hypothetical protein
MANKKRKKQKNGYTNLQLGLLADAFGRSLQTIQRWVDKSDDRLTSDKAKQALSELQNK